ncbi:promotilin-like isoform X2 [Pseudophryne corroboree]|uniref:promotilin-like isoform X2 n=1 Tax=Pseudophryne corroboree TaxID=495146 RepID=UPI0030814EDD
MDSRKVLPVLLLAYGICMLAEDTHGSFLHFFSHSDACNMQGGPCKKFLQQRSEGGDLRGAGGMEEESIIKLKAPVEIELRLDSQQMENFQNIVEDMFGDGETQKL